MMGQLHNSARSLLPTANRDIQNAIILNRSLRVRVKQNSFSASSSFFQLLLDQLTNFALKLAASVEKVLFRNSRSSRACQANDVRVSIRKQQGSLSILILRDHWEARTEICFLEENLSKCSKCACFLEANSSEETKILWAAENRRLASWSHARQQELSGIQFISSGPKLYSKFDFKVRGYF